MGLLSKKINIDFTDEITLLVALHQVKNFELYNKYQTLFARHFGFVRKKIPKKNIAL